MTDFMSSFGISVELPSMYVVDAKFYPSNCVYSLQLVRYVFPTCKDQTITTHYLDGKINRSNFVDIFEGYTNGLILRMLKRDHTSMKKIDEINIKTDNALLAFSSSGQMFALFDQDKQTIKICGVESD